MLFGVYELERRLGAGGMAETFVAVRRGVGGFEQRVCLKRILPAFESEEDFVRQFLEEARVSAQLRHANIVQVLDFGAVDGTHYLALELVEGLDLYRLLRELKARSQPVAFDVAAHLAIELATALDYAHRRPDGAVVHRDISPSNVLISLEGEVKLADFGIAKALSSRMTTTTQGVKGKVPYMAPEYALSGRFETRSDQFALGVLLFEVLAGRRPFVGNTDLDTLHRILEGKRPLLDELRPDVPRDLGVIVDRMLSTDPEARFAELGDAVEGLARFSGGATTRRTLATLARDVAASEKRSDSKPSGPSPIRLTSSPVLQAVPARTAFGVAEADANDPTRTSPQSPTRITPSFVNTSNMPSDPAHTRTDVGPLLVEELTPREATTIEVHAPAHSSISTPTSNVVVAGTAQPRSTPWGLLAVGSLLLVACGLLGVSLLRGTAAQETAVRGVHVAQERLAGAPVNTLAAASNPVRSLVARQLAEPTAVVANVAEDAGAPEASNRGTLRVLVLPHARNVSIDGHSMGGLAPYRRRVNEGTHTVEVVGPTGTSQRRQIRVGANESREVVFDFRR